MGQAIAQAIDSQDDLHLMHMWVRDERQAGKLSISPDVASSDLDHIAAVSDVLIDFSLPAALAEVAQAAVRYKKPLVSGVSGLDDSQLSSLDDVAAVVPVVYDRNMSVGVAVLKELVQAAAASLGPAFEAEIHETHHIHKKDAPSGTALKLGEAVADARNQDFREVACYAPQEGAGAPSAGDIHFKVERRGEVAGDHSVRFRSATELLHLSHNVTTRQVFADGALRAARWVVGQDPGRYQMKDVLFGKSKV